MTLYEIKDWRLYYEVSDSKKVDGPLSWVAVRTKQDGFGFRRISSDESRSDLFAAWMLMVQVAARQPREHRGKLVRDGRPLTAKALSMMTGWPEKTFVRAFQFFADPEQNWLIAHDVKADGSPATQDDLARPIQPDYSARPNPSESIRTKSDKSGPSGSTGQDRTGQDNNTGGAGAPPVPAPDWPTPEAIYAAYPRKEDRKAEL